jgi:Icc-related predicted phosphoesterase
MAVDNPEELEEKLCLICAPSLAKAFYETHGLKITICDIDERFKDLPGFHYFDLREPIAFENKFEYILFDPPFFYISLEQMSKAIQVLANGNKDIKLLMSFMTRDEKQVKSAFKMFNLEKTYYKLEYATVKPNRWENYGLYSNVDIPMIKRLKKPEKKHYL